MQRKNDLHGMLMRPCSTTLKDNKTTMHSTKVSVKSKFKDAYEGHIEAMQIVSECAKIYITENWNKVKNWSDLNVIIEDNSKKSTEYYNFKNRNERIRFGSNSNAMKGILARWEKRDKARHNPVKSVKGICLDTSDGDFSLVINSKQHLWISDDSVIIISDYIESQLKLQKTKK